MTDVPVFASRRDAWRFLVGIPMALVGFALQIPVFVGGPSRVVEFFWLSNAAMLCFFLGLSLSSGPVSRVQDALRARGSSRIAAFSPVFCFREAWQARRDVSEA